MRRDAEEGGGVLVHMVYVGMVYWLMVYFTGQRGREGSYQKSRLMVRTLRIRSALFEMREVPSCFPLYCSVHLELSGLTLNTRVQKGSTLVNRTKIMS